MAKITFLSAFTKFTKANFNVFYASIKATEQQMKYTGEVGNDKRNIVNLSRSQNVGSRVQLNETKNDENSTKFKIVVRFKKINENQEVFRLLLQQQVCNHEANNLWPFDSLNLTDKSGKM